MTSETLGERMRELRKDCGLTQEEASARINAAARYVGDIEQGRHIPTLWRIADLARLYGVSLDYIAGLTDRKRNPYVRRAE